jgi:flagellar biogenesis protein FliO
MRLPGVARLVACGACLWACALAHAQASPAIERTPLGQGKQAASQAASAEPVSPQSLGASAVQTTIALLLVLTLVLALALLVRWMARKGMLPAGLDGGLAGPGRARAVAGVLEVLARYPVGSGSTLLVMKFDRRVLLVHQTRAKGWRGPAQMTTLSELTAAEDVASILLRTRADDDAKRAAEFEAALRREDEAMARELAPPKPPARPAERARAVARKPVSAARPVRADLPLSGPGPGPASGPALGGGRYA